MLTFLGSLFLTVIVTMNVVTYAYAGSVAISSKNGETVVTLNGKQVWAGKTTGKVSVKTKSENGTEYAAAFDETKLIWENIAGAAKHF